VPRSLIQRERIANFMKATRSMWT